MATKNISSPLPGTFYRRSSPDNPPYILEGAHVNEGDIIGLIEIMKTYYEVKSDTTGTIENFLVESGDNVTAGQVLVEITI